MITNGCVWGAWKRAVVGVSERVVWAVLGTGDKAVQLSVRAGIVPNNRKRGEIHELDV